MCVFLLNFVSFFVLWELVYVFQSLCRSLQKKNLIVCRTRCLAVSFLEYSINWNSKSAELGFLKEERNSVVIHR